MSLTIIQHCRFHSSLACLSITPSPIVGNLAPTVHCPFNICSTTELPDVQARFRKGRGTRDQIANIHLILETGREFQKNIYFCFIDYAKDFDCLDHNKLWKILKEIGIPDHLTCLLRNLYADQEANS